MNTTQGTLCLATTAVLLLTACGADDDDGEAAEAGAEPTTVSPTEPPDETSDPSPEDENGESPDSEVFAAAEVADVAGNPLGTVTAAETDAGVRLSVEVQSPDVSGSSPRFRAVAVHEHGVCEIQSADQWGQIGDFNSAGAVLPGVAEEDPGVVEGEDELAETPAEEAPEGQDVEGQGVEDQGAQEPAEDLVRSERAGSLPNLMINEDGTGYLEVVSTDLSEQLLMADDGAAVIIYANADHHGNVPERYAPAGPDAGSLATGDAGARQACGVLEAAD